MGSGVTGPLAHQAPPPSFVRWTRYRRGVSRRSHGDPRRILPIIRTNRADALTATRSAGDALVADAAQAATRSFCGRTAGAARNDASSSTRMR